MGMWVLEKVVYGERFVLVGGERNEWDGWEEWGY